MLSYIDDDSMTCELEECEECGYPVDECICDENCYDNLT